MALVKRIIAGFFVSLSGSLVAAHEADYYVEQFGRNELGEISSLSTEEKEVCISTLRDHIKRLEEKEAIVHAEYSRRRRISNFSIAGMIFFDVQISAVRGWLCSEEYSKRIFASACLIGSCIAAWQLLDWASGDELTEVKNELDSYENLLEHFVPGSKKPPVQYKVRSRSMFDED